MNKERNAIKWAPFESLFKTNEIEKEIENNKQKIAKPILSEDTLKLNEENLLNAYHTKANVLIKYFYNEKAYQKKSKISFLNYYQKEIFLEDNSTIYFDQIINIQIL